MIPVRIVQLNASALKYLWQKFDANRTNFPDALAKDQIEFVCWLAAPDVQIFSVGESDTDPLGVFIFADIDPGNSAFAHIFMFEHGTYDYKELIASAQFVLLSVMRAHDLHSVRGLTPTPLQRAMKFAEAVGFKIDGHSRDSMRFHGEWVDGILTSILRDEAEKFEPKKEAV